MMQLKGMDMARLVTTRRVRQAAVAGSFYPADPQTLRTTVADMLAEASPPEPRVETRILIVPHAGYEYSGPVAATGYATLDESSLTRCVLVIGPSHFVPVHGAAMPIADTFETPLGSVPVDDTARRALGQIPEITRCAHCHATEHSLEVQLPFLQQLQPDLTTLPVLTGDRPSFAAEAIDLLAERGCLVVVSSDLSHYLPYEAAQVRDLTTVRAILGLRPGSITWPDACGRVAVQGALAVARRRGWIAQLLDLRNSGDTAGGRHRVVGYASVIIGPPR